MEVAGWQQNVSKPQLKVTLLDAGQPIVFVHAAALGLEGNLLHSAYTRTHTHTFHMYNAYVCAQKDMHIRNASGTQRVNLTAHGDREHHG